MISLILSGKICPYCGQNSELIDSSKIYNGQSYGMVYACLPCDAYVGARLTGNGAYRSLGRLAQAKLRNLKRQVHSLFDPIWKEGRMSRDKAYLQLAKKMNIQREFCHVGMFDETQCEQALQIIGRWVEKLL